MGYEGVIEKAGDKFGFIECEKLQEEGYERAFALSNELLGFQKGQSVRFTAYLDSQGRCQAKDLTAIKKGGKPVVAPPTRDEAGGELGQFSGVIDSRGAKFGFVKSEELEGQGYDKVFILSNE